MRPAVGYLKRKASEDFHNSLKMTTVPEYFSQSLIVTPHIAFNSQEALDKILETTLSNIQAFVAGRPQNVVVAVP